MKYQPLAAYLTHFNGPEWRAEFVDVERVLGFDLPAAARSDRGWWANDWSNDIHSQGRAWLAAGFETATVDMRHHRLTFRKIEAQGSARAAASDRPRAITQHEGRVVMAALSAGVAGFLVGRTLKRR